MRRLAQGALMATYRAVLRTGVLGTQPGRALFEGAYACYKLRVEAREIDELRPLVAPGTWVVDVGAGLGVLSAVFAGWTSEGGRVIAIEPEADNVARLRARVARAGLADTVEIVAGAAADVDGPLALAVDPLHPGDHRLAEAGVPVAGARIDSIVERLGRPPVSLVKIDVQGAEERVLAGAAATLARDRPALYVEVDDALLRRAGSSARALLERLLGLGYVAHRVRRGAPPAALDLAGALRAQAAHGYLDLLFLPRAPGRTG